MKKYLTTTFKVLIFLGIGVALFWLAYRGQDFGKIMESLGNCRWSWVLLALALSIAGHYSRAVRWRLLLEPFGYSPRNINLFSSVMVMYLTNMAIPRSGEVVRCGVVSKYEKIPFARCLGTVVTERIADMVVLAVLAVIIFATQGGVISGVLQNNPWVADQLVRIKGYLPLIIAGLCVMAVLAVLAVRMVIRRNIFGIGARLNDLVSNFKDGVLTIIRLERRTEFVLHSLFINFVYFYTIYLVFKAFPFCEELSLMAALTVFVLGTFGVIIPSPGGMGTWHFIVIELLALYGIQRDSDAGAYALVMHGIQDILFIVAGFAALMLMPVINNKYQPVVPDENTQEH